MAGEVFYWLLNMSITAGIAGVIVLLIGKIKRLPRRIAAFLWIIPFVRMTFPFGIGSRWGLMALISKFTTKTVAVPGSPDLMTMTNHIMAANGYFPVTYEVNILKNVFDVAAVVWFTIAAAVLLSFITIYCMTLAELKDAVKIEDGLYVSDKINSPAVYGLFCPRIILPKGYSEKDLPYVLAHERAHVRRRDNLRRVLAFIVTAVHWFNPLAWLFLREYLAQTELACDERVLAGLDAEGRKAYALTLVNASESRDMFASAFGGAKIRVRVTRILSYKKLSVFSICAFLLLAAAVIFALLTNAA